MDDRIINMGILVGVALGTTLISNSLYSRFTRNIIPSISHVHEGYVAPRDISMFVKDNDTSDGRGLPETYMKVGTNNYVLRYDTNNKPILSEYEVRPSTPSRVVVKE